MFLEISGQIKMMLMKIRLRMMNKSVEEDEEREN